MTLQTQVFAKIKCFFSGLATLCVLTACSQAPQFSSTDITGSKIGQTPWTLTNAQGQAVTQDSLKGKVTAIFFGYTRCPDVCPTTLSDYANALKLLGNKADKVQVIFITLDPDQDTYPNLQNYTQAFNPTFIALRGDAQATKHAADSYKVYYAKNIANPSQPTNYTVDHTAASYVYDAQGNIRLYVKHGMAVDLLAKDLALLVK